MSGKISAEMRRAVDLVKSGKTRYEAAKITGVSLSSISRSKLYQDYVKKQAEK